MSKEIPKVKTAELLGHFNNSVGQVAEHFDISRAAVYLWGDYIPDVRAYQVREDFPQLVEKKPKVA